MIIRTLLPLLFLTGYVGSINTVSADGFETITDPNQQTGEAQFEIQKNGSDFESNVARSFDDLVSMVEAEGVRIEDILKITLVVKYQNEQEPRHLVQSSKENWQAYQRTR
jgi:hypothetical protein